MSLAPRKSGQSPVNGYSLGNILPRPEETVTYLSHCAIWLETLHKQFQSRYNDRRPHWALIPEEGGDPLVPSEVYTGARSIRIPKWQGWAKGAKEKLDGMMSEAA